MLLMQVDQLVSHRGPKVCIEVAERFVKQVDGWVAGEEAPERDALALAAGELVWLALEQVGQAEPFGDGENGLLDFFLRTPAGLEPESEVVEYGKVREKGIVLEDHGQVTVLWLKRGRIAFVNQYASFAWLLESGEDS